MSEQVAAHRFGPRSNSYLVTLLCGIGAIATWVIRHHAFTLVMGILLLVFSALPFLVVPSLTGTVLRQAQQEIDLANIGRARLGGSARMVALLISDPSLQRPISLPISVNGKMTYREGDVAALTAALRSSSVNVALADEIDSYEQLSRAERRQRGAGLPDLRSRP